MLSNSSKYAIKAVLYIALHATIDKKVMAKDIYKPINVPQAYIAKLLQALVKARIVSSLKGPKGGFYMDDANLNKSVLSIISLIDGTEWLTNCMLSLEKCCNEKPCPLHDVLSASRNKIVDGLKAKTIKDFVVNMEAGHSFLTL